jgi:hypothetical protein
LLQTESRALVDRTRDVWARRFFQKIEFSDDAAVVPIIGVRLSAYVSVQTNR